MGKKIARDFFILLGLVLLWASTSRPAMEYITTVRDGKKWWSTYPCLNGDLVSMSYLDAVHKFNPGREQSHVSKAEYSGSKNIAMDLYGDSYTWELRDTNFAGVAVYNFTGRGNAGHTHIDKNRKSVLLIEISERFVRDYFGSPKMKSDFPVSETILKSASLPYYLQDRHMKYSSLVSIDNLFNKYINQNLQCNIFNYNFMMPMFTGKAALNYYFFNRASGDVVISDDRDHLFLKETVLKTGNASSYSPLPDSELEQMTDNINDIYDHYKSAGYDEVFLSMIPNSATINQPNDYNGLIPRIQSNKRLKIKIIDAYHLFKEAGGELYLAGDTHWNHRAMQKWVNLVNEHLLNINNN